MKQEKKKKVRVSEQMFVQGPFGVVKICALVAPEDRVGMVISNMVFQNF